MVIARISSDESCSDMAAVIGDTGELQADVLSSALYLTIFSLRVFRVTEAVPVYLLSHYRLLPC